MSAAGDWKAELLRAVERGERCRLLELAREAPQRALASVTRRLYSAEETEKLQAVQALGWLVAEKQLYDELRVTELARRFVWALNDESGAVPYGIPEALGELLRVRPELRPAFLPVLCSLLTEAELRQTGPIEEGVVWALGRLGACVLEYCPEIEATLEAYAAGPPDRRLAQLARQALDRLRADRRATPAECGHPVASPDSHTPSGDTGACGR